MNRIIRLLEGTPSRPVSLMKVSEKTGIPYSTLCRYKEKRDLPLSRAIQISKAINQTTEEWEELRR